MSKTEQSPGFMHHALGEKNSLMYVIVCEDGTLEERDYYVSNLRLDLSQAAADSTLK